MLWDRHTQKYDHGVYFVGARKKEIREFGTMTDVKDSE